MENLKYTEILQQNRELRKAAGRPNYQITILSNVTINSLTDILEYVLLKSKINPTITVGNYDNIVQDSSACSSSDLVIIFYETLTLIDNLGRFFEDVDDNFYRNLKEKVFSEIDLVCENLKNVPAVIFNTFLSGHYPSNSFRKSRLDLFIDELNEYLELKKKINTSLANLNKIVSTIGFKQAFDYRLYHSSKAPYTLSFLKNYVASIAPLILRNTGRSKKAIIFDCDNTLWKGIIGEDGIDKIDMSSTSSIGRKFQLVQQIAVFLSKQGVIVGLCSKNNDQDVLEVIQKHPEMALKLEHIVIQRINWNDKASNIESIAKELNIGLDSIVFVDDSSFEISLIQERLPEVSCIQVPTSGFEYPDYLLRNIYLYFNLEAGKEDLARTKLYKEQSQRESIRSSYDTIDAYLASLDIVIDICKDEISCAQRVTQLTQKTNQFNLTTKRYSENEILNLMNSNTDWIFIASVKDKFGDNGITALCIINQDKNDSETVILDTFLMSCRIIGRNIEMSFISHIFNWLKNHNFKTVRAKYIATNKNAQVEKFYDSLGLDLINTVADVKFYSMDIEDYRERDISYIAKVVSHD
jgi:FkbH-like protein